MFSSDNGPVDSLRSVAESDDALREILYETAPCHTASQKELVNSLASERDRRMQELDAEMARLTDALSRLAAEKDRIQEEYRLCRMALASPIRALPSEILCEIFELRVKRTPWGEPPRSIDDFLPPTVWQLLATTWICRRWRRIAHGMSWLWRELPLGWRMIDHRYAGPCVQEWLARSKDVPLTYTIAHQQARKRSVSPPPRLRSDFLVTSAMFPTARIQQLRLVGSAMDITLPLSILPPNSFPLLTKLHLNFLFDPLDAPTPSSIRDVGVAAFAESSGLNALRLEGYVQEGVIDPLPLSCVTSLQLDLGSYTRRKKTRSVLRRCPNLTHLRLHAEYASRGPHDDGSLITLDKLNSLSVYEAAYEIWEELNAPNLKTLNWFAGSFEYNNHVSSFLSRAPCLTSLTLAEVSINDYADIRDILRLLPRVESFTLQRCSLRLGQMYHAMAVRSEAETLVPCLRSLVLKEIDSYQDSPSLDAFVTMMRSRRALSDASPAHELRVEWDFPDFVERDDEIESKLGAMQEEGLDLHFS